MATEKSRRTIDLLPRSAKITNLNFSPEKAGTELVERVDLSLKFVVIDKEIEQVINAKGDPLQLLWAKDGTVMLREIKTLPIGLIAEGTFRIGIDEENLYVFDDAVLKKLKVTPHMNRQAEVTCQVRVDPGDYLADLGHIRVTENCVFSFMGRGKDEPQGELEV